MLVPKCKEEKFPEPKSKNLDSIFFPRHDSYHDELKCKTISLIQKEKDETLKQTRG